MRCLGLFSILCLLLLPVCTGGFAHSTCTIEPPYRHYKVIAVTVSTTAQLDQLTRILTKYCEIRLFKGDKIHLHRQALLIITPDQYSALREAANSPSPVGSDRPVALPPIKLLSDDLHATLALSPKQRSGYIRRNFLTTRDNSSVPALDTNFYTRYSTFDDFVAKWSNLTQLYSQHIKTEVIGKSLQGRDIIVLRIGKTDPGNPKRLLLNGLQHAREWIAALVPTYIAETLAVSAAGGTDTFSNLLKTVEVVIAPLVNPDGYVYSRSTFRLARKNRRKAGCFLEAREGVDLNRNWGKDYGGSKSTSTDVCSDVFIGTGAFSEPESDALRRFVQRNAGIKAHVDFHSFGQLVLGAWAFTDDDPPGSKESADVGEALERAMTGTSGQLYRFGKGRDLLYLASGVMSDWITSLGILSFTVELRPTVSNSAGSGFQLPATEITPTCKEGVAATDILLQYVSDSSSILKPRSGSSKALIIGLSIGGGVLVACCVVVLVLVLFLRVRHARASARDPDASHDAGGNAESRDGGVQRGHTIPSETAPPVPGAYLV